MNDLIEIVNEILERYTDDEVGQAYKSKYEEMTNEQKLQLLANTINSAASWEDFETDLVINFDYCNY